MAESTMVEALNQALHELMEDDGDVLVLGEDVGEDGGIFRVTEGLHDRFGPERVIDTPLAEALIVGSSVGMAIAGLKPICELQFSGFSYHAFHQIESHVSRFRWRSQGRYHLPMVIRMPYGAGVRALEHHSESKEAYFAHTPGLKTVIPSSPRRARSLLAAAVSDPDPVVFMEPKRLYRSVKEEVPDEEDEPMEIGPARLAREGEDIALMSYGAMLVPTLEAADRLAEDGVSARVLDLQTISPLDHEAVGEAAQATGRIVIVDEAHRGFGPASEIAAVITDTAFWRLEAPIERVTGFDVPVPMFAREEAYLPDAERVLAAARRALAA